MVVDFLAVNCDVVVGRKNKNELQKAQAKSLLKAQNSKTAEAAQDILQGSPCPMRL